VEDVEICAVPTPSRTKIKQLLSFQINSLAIWNIQETTVATALHNRSWIARLRGGFTVPAIHEYLHIWDKLREI
jgi:hypothetical protein